MTQPMKRSKLITAWAGEAVSDKLQSAEGFAADLWNSTPDARAVDWAQGWIAEVVPDIKERDRQQREAGWRACAEACAADDDRISSQRADLSLVEKLLGSSYYSLKDSAFRHRQLTPPAAQPASESAKVDVNAQDLASYRERFTRRSPRSDGS